MRLYPLFILLLLLLSVNSTVAQSEKDILMQKMYEGSWYNKETKRHIDIRFNEELSYVTINDWTGKQHIGSIDSYKAFIKENKLILYAENDDHHSPYCEMEVVDQKLIYQCNEPFNFKDQFLNSKNQIDKTEFKRLKK